MWPACWTTKRRLKVLKENWTHLEALEAESIYIIREVVAQFRNPVLLYSIGKDSSVLVHLARKAFHPGPIPFPLLHVDTGYKFREMIDFRDAYTTRLGVKLIVHRNEEALADGANPFKLGTQRCCGLLKTQSLLDALREGGFDAAFGGTKRSRGPKSGSTPSAIRTASGIRRISGRSFGTCLTAGWSRARASGCSP